MTEYFDVDPGHVAGYGRLCADVGGDANGIAAYLGTQADSSGFDGELVGTMIGPIVDEYAESAATRVRTLGQVLFATSGELADTAWTYLGADKPERFTMVEDTIGRGEYRVEQDHPQLFAYPYRPVDGLLATPTLAEMDVEQLVEDNAGDTLEAIEWIVAKVTGLVGESFSITGEITSRIAGNWLALNQKADALDNAADAAEAAVNGLVSERTTLDRHWDGGAAMGFAAYLDRLVAGLRYEGPLNRVVAAAYRVAALLIEEAAGLAVEAVGAGVEIIRKWATGGVGRGLDMAWGLVSDGDLPWDTIRADWEQAKSFFGDAKAAVEMAREVPAELRALIDATRSPEAAADYSVSTALEDMVATGEIDEDDASSYQLGYDIAKEAGPALAEVPDLPTGDDLENVPGEGFDAGHHVRRAG